VAAAIRAARQQNRCSNEVSAYPVNAGTTGSLDAVVEVDVVVVVGTGSGPTIETTNGWSRTPSKNLPTAVHETSLMHDTPAKRGLAPAAFGVVTFDHALPSQLIAKLSSSVPVELNRPTATHDVAFAQETPNRYDQAVPGLGLF